MAAVARVPTPDKAPPSPAGAVEDLDSMGLAPWALGPRKALCSLLCSVPRLGRLFPVQQQRASSTAHVGPRLRVRPGAGVGTRSGGRRSQDSGIRAPREHDRVQRSGYRVAVFPYPRDWSLLCSAMQYLSRGLTPSGLLNTVKDEAQVGS